MARKTKRKAPTRITPELAQEMFVMYCEQRDVRAVARKFKVSESTVHRLKKKDRWVERFDGVIERVHKKTETRAVNGVALRIKATRAIFNAAAAKLAEHAKLKTLDVSVRDFVLLSRHLLELEGGAEEQSEGNSIVVNIVNRIRTADPAERERITRNALAGLGIRDPGIVRRLSALRAGTGSQN